MTKKGSSSKCNHCQKAAKIQKSVQNGTKSDTPTLKNTTLIRLNTPYPKITQKITQKSRAKRDFFLDKKTCGIWTLYLRLSEKRWKKSLTLDAVQALLTQFLD